MRYKILVINWQDITNPLSGGAEVHLHEIFKRVVARGHRVSLLCCKYPGSDDRQIIDGIQIIRRGSRNTFNFYVRNAYRALSKSEHFDIVFDDINKIPFYTPLFVQEPIVAIVHHFFGWSIFLETNLPQASYVYLSERFVPAIYRRIPFAVVSESTRQELVAKGVRSTITLLPNAVDLGRYSLIQDVKSERPLIGYFGRLKKYKSIDHFIKAVPEILRQWPSAEFIVVGDGDYRSNLERLAKSLKVARHVRFMGTVSHREKVLLLNQMWVAVNPSPKEGWGLTVIEANACGTPVVAANSPGLCDSVVDGRTGYLYQYANVKDLADHVVRLLKNTDMRIRMSYCAREWAEGFNWDNSAQIAIGLTEKTLSRRN